LEDSGDCLGLDLGASLRSDHGDHASGTKEAIDLGRGNGAGADDKAAALFEFQEDGEHFHRCTSVFRIAYCCLITAGTPGRWSRLFHGNVVWQRKSEYDLDIENAA
jgi:hypothetical protein